MTGVQKFWKFLGESSFYKNVGKLHTKLYRLSGGRVGSQTGGIKNLLLTTTGRRTGEKRTCPLAYIEDAGRFVVIASNGGNEKHPVWYLNLQADSRATIEVGPRGIAVVASTAVNEERAQLWSKSVRSNPQYAVYESITPREIPVVILTPAA